MPAVSGAHHGEAATAVSDLERLERRARELLGRSVYDYYAGGSGQEVTLRESVTAWDQLRLRPHVLRDVAAVSTAATVLGLALETPVLVAPMAYQGLLHPEAEVAMARGAGEAGSLMVLSARSSLPPAAVAATAAPTWAQVYILRDRARTAALVEQAVAAKARALVLTGDTPLVGSRPRDVANRFELPDPQRAVASSESSALAQDPGATLDDIAWLRSLAPTLPILVKGVLRGDDAWDCVAAGASGVVVSNHGGRQLDGVLAPARALGEVVAAVGTAGEVYVDGGIRRGRDVLAALALGARGVLVGRPAAWALTVGGAAGVASLLRALSAELAQTMALVGAPELASLRPDLVVDARLPPP